MQFLKCLQNLLINLKTFEIFSETDSFRCHSQMRQLSEKSLSHFARKCLLFSFFEHIPTILAPLPRPLPRKAIKVH